MRRMGKYFLECQGTRILLSSSTYPYHIAFFTIIFRMRLFSVLSLHIVSKLHQLGIWYRLF